MEDQNKKPCWTNDRKEMQRVIDYFICRLRRCLIVVIFTYFVVNFFFNIFTFYIFMLTSPGLLKNNSRLDKVMNNNITLNSPRDRNDEKTKNNTSENTVGAEPISNPEENSGFKKEDMESISENNQGGLIDL